MVTNNAVNIESAGLVKYDGAGTFTGVTTTIHDVLLGAASNGITNVAPSATAGIPLISNGAAVDPSFGVATVPGGGTGNDNIPAHAILIGANTNPIGTLSPAASGTLVQSLGAASDPAYTTAAYPSSAGTSGNVITSNGTNFQSLPLPTFPTTTLTNHSIALGTGTANLSSVGPSATAGTIVQSAGAASDPVFSTASYPSIASTSGNVITSNGTNFVSSAPAGSSLITTFTGSGSWTKNSRSVAVEFYVWSGGGGGGSGRAGASGASGGGGGGGCGNLVYLKASAAALTSSPYTVTIGSGGTGGGSVNGTLQNGNPGIIGGTSSVGTIIVVPGGQIGAGGITSAAAGGAGLFYNLSSLSAAGSTGNGAAAVGATPTAIIYGWGTSGGGGSGYTSATPRLGGVGGAITGTDGTTLVAGGLAGANTGATAGNGNSPAASVQLLMIGGTGGGGGGMDGTITAGTGGNGAQPGGGGGGGAGNLSTNATGAGGNGGNGQVIIIEYF